jgi:hypothetical protein
MSGATFTADALMALAMNKSTTPVVRLLMFACERADRTGVACFDAGELHELLHEGDDAKTIEHDLRFVVGVGLALPDSTAESIRLDLSMVQPEGFPEVGARYGDLTLEHRVEGDKWLCACDCGSRRTYMLLYLVSGITRDCGQHRPVK